MTLGGPHISPDDRFKPKLPNSQLAERMQEIIEGIEQERSLRIILRNKTFYSSPERPQVKLLLDQVRKNICNLLENTKAAGLLPELLVMQNDKGYNLSMFFLANASPQLNDFLLNAVKNATSFNDELFQNILQAQIVCKKDKLRGYNAVMLALLKKDDEFAKFLLFDFPNKVNAHDPSFLQKVVTSCNHDGETLFVIKSRLSVGCNSFWKGLIELALEKGCLIEALKPQSAQNSRNKKNFNNNVFAIALEKNNFNLVDALLNALAKEVASSPNKEEIANIFTVQDEVGQTLFMKALTLRTGTISNTSNIEKITPFEKLLTFAKDNNFFQKILELTDIQGKNLFMYCLSLEEEKFANLILDFAIESKCELSKILTSATLNRQYTPLMLAIFNINLKQPTSDDPWALLAVRLLDLAQQKGFLREVVTAVAANKYTPVVFAIERGLNEFAKILLLRSQQNGCLEASLGPLWDELKKNDVALTSLSIESQQDWPEQICAAIARHLKELKNTQRVTKKNL
ncbi:MAG TPA: hypothetical protein PKD37_01155 [Oligoflexia bacterium]|nr:hypothetical protein [Oligoflexia bacterium]HMP26585.1 hypothetical protein [Oligoflexia bacterium]